jgi:hypothetical protein
MRVALTTDALAEFCRHKRRKIPAALAVAGGVTQAEAASIEPVARLLKLACT